MKKTDFFKEHGHRLLITSIVDQYGVETKENVMILYPDELYDAKECLEEGYSVASVFEVENEEDNVEIDNDLSYSPYKIGFFILKND